MISIKASFFQVMYRKILRNNPTLRENIEQALKIFISKTNSCRSLDMQIGLHFKVFADFNNWLGTPNQKETWLRKKKKISRLKQWKGS